MELKRVSFEVRDSELDVQGRVNNANYFHYLEHARHQGLKAIGCSFSKLAAEKQYAVLLSTSVEFKQPLLPEEQFFVDTKLVPHSKIRFAFKQEIRKKADDSLVLTAENICVFIDGNNNNRPYMPFFIKQCLDRESSS